MIILSMVIFIYYDEDEDKRLLITGGMLYQLLEDNEINSNLHIYEHEGGLLIYTEDKKIIDIINNKLNNSIGICGDVWGIVFVDKKDWDRFSKRRKLEPEIWGTTGNTELKYADDVIF